MVTVIYPFMQRAGDNFSLFNWVEFLWVFDRFLDSFLWTTMTLPSGIGLRGLRSESSADQAFCFK